MNYALLNYTCMAFLLMHSKFCYVIYKIDGKESRSIQHSILGLSYFKEFHKDQFLVLHCLIFTTIIYFFGLKGIDICNFADSLTPHVCDLNLASVLETLQHNFELAIGLFEMNYMKRNTDKCHLLVSGNKYGQM